MQNRRAQSSFEFSILIVIVLGALLTMQVYMKRAVQGRWKAASDDVGDQYDPRSTNGTILYQLSGESKTQVLSLPSGTGYWTTRTDQSNSIETRSGKITMDTPP